MFVHSSQLWMPLVIFLSRRPLAPGGSSPKDPLYNVVREMRGGLDTLHHSLTAKLGERLKRNPVRWQIFKSCATREVHLNTLCEFCNKPILLVGCDVVRGDINAAISWEVSVSNWCLGQGEGGAALSVAITWWES